MADGAGQMEIASSLLAAQAELTRQMASLAQQLGTVSAQVQDRVTHKELMQSVGDGRRETAGKLEHMEGKFDAATNKVETFLNTAVDRIKGSLPGVADDAVAKALALREAQEAKAMSTIQRSEADIERRIKNSGRLAFGGFGAGGIGVIAAVGQALGWWH